MNLGRLVGVIAAVLLLVGAAVFFLFRYTFTVERLQTVQNAVGIETSPPESHIVEEGFRGWAIVSFGVGGAPPLEVVDGVAAAEYPASGRLETSTLSPDAKGLLHREYFERRADDLVPLKRLGQIWGEYSIRIINDDLTGQAQSSFGFFVGTMADFRASDRPMPGLELPELPIVPSQPE